MEESSDDGQIFYVDGGADYGHRIPVGNTGAHEYPGRVQEGPEIKDGTREMIYEGPPRK